MCLRTKEKRKTAQKSPELPGRVPIAQISVVVPIAEEPYCPNFLIQHQATCRKQTTIRTVLWEKRKCHLHEVRLAQGEVLCDKVAVLRAYGTIEFGNVFACDTISFGRQILSDKRSFHDVRHAVASSIHRPHAKTIAAMGMNNAEMFEELLHDAEEKGVVFSMLELMKLNYDCSESLESPLRGFVKNIPLASLAIDLQEKISVRNLGALLPDDIVERFEVPVVLRFLLPNAYRVEIQIASTTVGRTRGLLGIRAIILMDECSGQLRKLNAPTIVALYAD